MEYKTKTHLILPFNGAWIVGNGGRNSEDNNHYSEDGSTPDNQIYAYDFSRNHGGNGTQLEDYEAFGKEVIAPANGIISIIENSQLDLPIGERDKVRRSGNKIIIDHQNGEFSFIAHFKQESIKVKVGDRVKQGVVLGLCGNSGNTTEPHIHYHLQDSLLPEKAAGLPAQFRRINVNGLIKENCELEYKQKVSNL